jgi:hypothetical protein
VEFLFFEVFPGLCVKAIYAVDADLVSVILFEVLLGAFVSKLGVVDNSKTLLSSRTPQAH